MQILKKKSYRRPLSVRYGLNDPDQSGSILIYMVVVMLIFGFLGAGMISMFTASTMMSSGVPNYARNAGYVAEAGVRYATSELRNNGYTKGNISTLNSTTYTLDNGDSFKVNVFGKWFEPVADYNAGSGTLSLSIPQWNTSMGQFPSSTITTDDFDIPAGAYVVNLEGYRDSQIYKVYGSTPEKFTAEIQGVAYSSININLTDDFQASTADPVCLAVKYTGTATQTATPTATYPNNVLKLPLGAEKFFPEKFGSFHVTNTMAEKKHYFYETMTDAGSHIELAGLSDAVTVAQNDYIILSPRNHMITATGASGSTVSGGENFYTANYRQNIESPQDIKPPSMDLPPDVDTATALAGMTTVGESDSAAVDVDTVTGEITLGGGVYSTYGAVFFGGDVSLGGASVCSGGKCVFGEGLRAFFVVDYNGSGDGFTFAVMNGAENVLGASGIGADRLGYAGSGIGGGLKPPKMAIEFDTWVNAASDRRNDPDLGTSNRDVLQYVFWGEYPASDLDDDNVHDLGGSGPKWDLGDPPNEGYLPASGPEDIRTKPVLNSAETRLYFTSKNGYLHAIDPFDASAISGFPVSLDGDPTESSPVLDSNGLIFTGGDNNFLNVIKKTGTLGNVIPDDSWAWWDYVYADVKSSPVIDSSDVVYFGDNDGDFYAYENSCANPPDNCPYKWKSPFRYPGDGNDIKGTPALSPDEKTVYFVSTQANYLYALNTFDGTLKWRFYLAGVSDSSPIVADDGTIYVGSNGGTGSLYAVNPNNSEKWHYSFSGLPKSRPAIGPDGTIYIGNDDDYLYAITDNGSYKWSYPTGGNVKGGPTVHDDGTIWFGSDDNNLYVVDSNGLLIDTHPTGGSVKSSPTQGADGTVYVGADDRKLYAFRQTCYPQNIKTRVFSYDDLYDAALTNNAVEDLANVTDSDDWLNSGRWAVRVEMTRSTTPNARGRYEYTLHTWARQCDIADHTACSAIANSYFADTRIDYAAQAPHLEQTAELCPSDHDKFNTFMYGFTEGTGGAGTQTVVIDKLELGFIRPGDAVITNDPNWDWP